MEPRKFILLLLPVTIAFLVGGFGGRIFGIEEFFWPGAILWGAVIFIIDYNFTMLEKMSWASGIGRFILIVASALITATVGDHILFEDTIKAQKTEHLVDNADYKKLLVERDDIQDEIRRMQSGVNKLTADYVKETSGDRGNVRGIGPVAKGIDAKITAAKAELNYQRTELKAKKQEIKDYKSEQAGEHDIIKEIQLLYEYIFSQTVSTVIFLLLSFMVITIEILPLMLKSGKTRKGILRKRQQTMWRTLHRNL